MFSVLKYSLGRFFNISQIGIDYCVDTHLRHSAEVVSSFNTVCCHSILSYVCESISKKM